MANVLYPKFKETLLSGDIDLTSDTIKLVLVDTADYTYSASHEFFDDIDSGAIVATSGAFSGKSVTNGVFDADDVTLTTVTGDQSEALVIFKDTGVDSTSLLIAYLDSATGLPVTPSGGDITIVWSSGSSKIFAL